MTTGATYRDAGVDIDAGAEAVDRIKSHLRSTYRPEVLGDVGFFGGLFKIEGFESPVLVSSTDSVGTKVKVAAAMGRYDTIGADIVNHCVNDVFVAGAQPLFFLDYLATSKLDPAKIETIVSGMAAACREAGCALIGGETAELPDTYQEGDYEVVGFMVGAVEEANIIDGSKIRDGDLLLGLPSSGLHTNGYSLARKIFDIGRPGGANSQLDRHVAELHMTLGEALLTVHRSYYPTLRPHLDRIAGMAHITGGGIIANTQRIVPEGLEATVDFEAWETPAIFRLIQERGSVSDDEMRKTFNMGIGMVVVASPANAAALGTALPEAIPIGSVTTID